MANLYELSAAYAALIDAYDGAETDEEREDVLARLAEAEGDIADKAEAYARIMKNKQAEADAFKAEADRLTAKKRAAENVVQRMKDALLDAMRLTETSEIPTSIGKWRKQMNPLSCEVMNADAVPMEYHIPQPDKFDKKGMIAHYKATGEVINGVEFKQEEGIRFR